MYIDFSNKRVNYRKQASSFKPFFSKSEQAEIVHSLYDRHAWDGETTRIEDIQISQDEVVLTLALSSFFESLTSNGLIYQDASGLRPGLREKVEDYQNMMKSKEDLKTTFLQEAHLANSTAISLVVQDSTSRILLTQRTEKVAVAKGFYSVSVAGTVDGDDFRTLDPVRHCALHELEEELNIHLKLEDIELQGLYIDDLTYKPSFFAGARLSEPFDLDLIQEGKDFENEVARVFFVEPDELEKFKGKTFTSGAIEQLALYGLG